MRERTIIVGTAQDDAERAQIERRLAPWRGNYPEVPLEFVVTHDSAASALVGASLCAQLVVVGSHRRGSLRGDLPGSAGLQLLHHAQCPVLVDHQDTHGEDTDV